MVKENQLSGFERNPRVAGVIREAEGRGLLDVKSRPLGGRLYEGLLDAAKRASGIESTTELLTYALAKVAVEDDFGPKLVARAGRVPKGLLSGE